jgi:predicted ATPase
MEFVDILEQTIALLQHQGRLLYGALKRRFGLNDAYLDDLKIELIEAQQLARLLQCQGKRTAAYELLAPVYGWFTEGFDTADLQEAKALLAELV